MCIHFTTIPHKSSGMKISFCRHILAMLLLWSYGFTTFQPGYPEMIQGKVVQEGSLVPVEEAYVHTLVGEEETFTKKDGSFVLQTWQAFPVECTVEHKDYAIKKIVINKDKKKVIIYLAKK
jgi:hypothetical protein